MTKTLSRAQARKAIKEMPIENILLVGKSDLTAKQKAFAQAVALGNTGAESYRIAYDTKAKPKHQGNKASELKADERIQREIQAYMLANEAAKYRTSEALRNLVIQSLTQVLINPDTKDAQRVQAAKVLGTVTEVAAFTERREVINSTGSAAIKEKILAELKTLMLGGNGDVTDIDADDLLSELALSNQPDDMENADLDSEDPTLPRPPQTEESRSQDSLHITSHEGSNSLSIDNKFRPDNSSD